MADKKKCNEAMPPWFKHVCGKPAKFICAFKVIGLDGDWKTVKGNRCGIHAKRYERIEEIK